MSFDEKNLNRRLELVEKSFDEHGSYLRDYLCGLTKNLADASELLDDVFIYAYRHLEGSDISNIKLLRQKARWLFLDWYRRQRRNRVIAVEDVPEIIAPASHEALTEAEERVYKDRFFNEFDAGLSQEDKNILWLSARMGYTHAEIATQLKMSSSTVGDRLKRIRKVFVEYLNNN